MGGLQKLGVDAAESACEPIDARRRLRFGTAFGGGYAVRRELGKVGLERRADVYPMDCEGYGQSFGEVLWKMPQRHLSMNSLGSNQMVFGSAAMPFTVMSLKEFSGGAGDEFCNGDTIAR